MPNVIKGETNYKNMKNHYMILECINMHKYTVDYFYVEYYIYHHGIIKR